MSQDITRLIAPFINGEPTAVYDLAGGCVGDVKRLRFADDRTVVIKLDPNESGGLEVEGRMLRYLKDNSDLPVPEVIGTTPGMLLMSDLGGSTGARGRAQEEAARALSALHSISAASYGLDFDTRIGGLVQKNSPSTNWPAFFRDQRLLAMAEEAHRAGQLTSGLRRRIDFIANRLEEDLSSPHGPSLIHGDVWAGNILAKPKRLLGFIDPAIYYADKEVELAFINLFGTFSRRFFHIYGEEHELHDDFEERRQHIYNLYPLLVHVRLFGTAYAEQLDRLLTNLGVPKS